MLQQEKREDFVIATGQQTSMRDFSVRSASELGITLAFSGEATSEKGVISAINRDIADPNMTAKVGDVVIRVDEKYYRPTEVETLLGDPTEAKIKLGWEPTTTLDEMIKEMITTDLTTAKKNRLLAREGYAVNTTLE